MERYIPEVKSKLRSRIIEVPPVIYKATGIKVLGTRIKSLLFSTDVAVIKNTNANSIIAVYPFTPQLSITQAILEVAPVPVFVGVGGGLTTGKRSVDIALQAELMGAYGVVVNAPTSKEVISKMYKRIDIPIIATIASDCDDYKAKLDAGARILNISGGPKTAEIVRNIREDYGKELPIIATGGPTDESILETIEAGANAITYTPPSSGEVFSDIMDQYRIKKESGRR
ncbi:hydrolase [Anaerosalibacter bizertensis]|uniref:Hydrolase n=1 Tax=Anaerosalibacter bizertensis TaxID=932217 RepID=A0A9Q4AEI2_9FIRM|nr:hydrolase [Anaerosalibacter bizertensis]MBV1821654.1 hydrolase [Bacteroidales bacterium MSK.15.36]MCB5560679.1 hydrolase [Anaerosalibacter bizertensis]MCG4566133.1 hydrolase [Anaerosalibacter bizertensis]MCG4583634.1 hydrolase [Anaerosalibacter bizertensis]MCG4586190.1 hydrolase [Anaerosalibacter bizertensis]